MKRPRDEEPKFIGNDGKPIGRRSVVDRLVLFWAAASVVMKAFFARLRSVARSDLTVVLYGDTGTGKELAARAVHEASPRRAGPFVAVHCGAIPNELIESELFGHMKGSFTGAVMDRRGKFAEADGGTLFLDEVSEMPPTMQTKILRFLQEREYTPVGGEGTRHADVRIVAATNRDLFDMARAGLFRSDLYYRLAQEVLTLPSLRDRIVEDLDYLLAACLGEDVVVTEEARARLLEYSWPGNMREFENVVHRARRDAEGGPIDRCHLRFDVDLWMTDASLCPTPSASASSALGSFPLELQVLFVVGALPTVGFQQDRAARALGWSQSRTSRLLSSLPEARALWDERRRVART